MRPKVFYTKPLEWECVSNPDWESLGIPDWRTSLAQSSSGGIYVIESKFEGSVIKVSFTSRFRAEEWYMQNVCNGKIITSAVFYCSSYEHRKKLGIIK